MVYQHTPHQQAPCDVAAFSDRLSGGKKLPSSIIPKEGFGFGAAVFGGASLPLQMLICFFVRR
ncbi:MAG: hypothetical protein OXG39_07535 [Chloroflexi bacterium]|nr:hypothetical protein [Chloroflexota bacterium]